MCLPRQYLGLAFLSAGLVVSLAPTPSALAAEDHPGTVHFIRGDANADGAIDISDAIYILLYLFRSKNLSRPPDCLDALDVDDDGKVDLSDPISLLDFLFKGGLPPHPPFPLPGIDPTGDSLVCGPSPRLSISVNPTDWSLSGVPVNSTHLTGPKERIQITNTGNSPVTLALHLISPSGWTAGPVPGLEQVALSALIAHPDNGPSVEAFNTEGTFEDTLSPTSKRANRGTFSFPGAQATGEGIPASQTRALSLLLQTPIRTARTDEQVIQVVITAEAP